MLLYHFFFNWRGHSCLKYLCSSYNTKGYCGFHSFWDLWEGCSIPSAGTSPPPHLASLLCTQTCSQAPAWDWGPVNLCQALSGCGTPNGSMLNVFALISADSRLYKESLSGTVSVSLLVTDSPFLILQQVKRKLHCPYFSTAGLDGHWHGMMCFWNIIVWKPIKIWPAGCQVNILQHSEQKTLIFQPLRKMDWMHAWICLICMEEVSKSVLETVPLFIAFITSHHPCLGAWKTEWGIQETD